MGHRIRRITLDWDFKNPFVVCYRLIKVLKYLSGKEGEQIIIKKSHKKGFHIFLWTRAYGDKFKIREELHDDKNRIRFDKNHTYGRNTLFQKKRKYVKHRRTITKLRKSTKQ